MRSTQCPWYLLLAPIVGYDESGDNDDDNDQDDDVDDEEEERENEESEEELDAKALKERADALDKALKNERRAHRATKKASRVAAQDVHKKEVKEQGDKDKNEVEEATVKAADAEAKAQRLAARFLKNAVDLSITKLATSSKFRFRDVDDALALIDRTAIEVDQDDDDPEDIDIDADTVEAALKKLAKTKPHLLARDDEEDDAPSGGKFGGKRKDKDELTDDMLRERYPTLRH